MGKSEAVAAKKIAFSSLSGTAWKNGGGVTREIAIWPADSSLDKLDFTWRLSTAEVAQPGPFSLFPGYERLIAVVTGKELVLTSSEEMAALRRGDLFHFLGEVQMRCDLPKGPVKDLSLIFRADQINAGMNSIRFESRTRSFRLGAGIHFFHAAGEFAATVYPGELTFGLKESDSLLIEASSTGEERLVMFEPTVPGGIVMGIEIVTSNPAVSN